MNKNILKGAALVAAASMLSPLAIAEDDGPSWGISGWINEGVTYWDDGTGSDVTQISDNGTTLGSRITLSGSTPLAGTGLTAGFEVIMEPLSGTPNFAGGGQVTPLLFAGQGNIDTFNGGDIGVLGSSLNVGGAWGKLTFGLQSMPTDNIAVLADPSLTLWSGISPVFRGNGFAIRGLTGGAAASWGSFLQCLTTPGLGIGIDCNGVYRNGVRYDLPAFGPVSVAVGYANDDIFDISVKYSGTVAGLTANVHGGYAVNANGGTNVGATDGSDVFQIQAGLMDPNSGIFGSIAYQVEEADNPTAGTGNDTDAWWTKIGIKKNWVGYGDTAISFDYGQYNDQYGATAGISGSEVERWGLSVDQYFGSNLIIYGKYENLGLDVDGANAGLYSGAEDLDTFTLGLTYFF